MKESHHILSEEADKRETIHCIIYASVVMFGMLALLLHGLAFFSWKEPTMNEFYAMKNMNERIIVLENKYENHTHIYNGKPR